MVRIGTVWQSSLTICIGERMNKAHKVAEILIIDTGFSRTVDEKWICDDGGLVLWRQVYSDYSWSLETEEGKIIPADSFEHAIERGKEMARQEKVQVKKGGKATPKPKPDIDTRTPSGKVLPY